MDDCGTYKELLRKGTDFASLVKVEKEENNDECDDCYLAESNGYLQRSFSNTGLFCIISLFVLLSYLELDSKYDL